MSFAKTAFVVLFCCIFTPAQPQQAGTRCKLLLSRETICLFYSTAVWHVFYDHGLLPDIPLFPFSLSFFLKCFFSSILLLEDCEFLFRTATPYNTPGNGSLPNAELAAWLVKESPSSVQIDETTVQSGANSGGNWVSFAQPSGSGSAAACEAGGALTVRFEQADMAFSFVGKDNAVWVLRADPNSVIATAEKRTEAKYFQAATSSSQPLTGGATAGIIIGTLILALVVSYVSVQCRSSARSQIFSDDCTDKLFGPCLPSEGGGNRRRRALTGAGKKKKSKKEAEAENTHTPFMHENPMYSSAPASNLNLSPAW